MSNRIAIFIDGPNFFYMQKDGLKWFVDPKKIIEWAKRRFNGDVVDATYYASVGYDSSDTKNESFNKDRARKVETFLKALPFMGYTVTRKPVKIVRDGDDSWSEANVFITMSLDILATKDNFDTVIFVSGSGEFEEIVDRMKAMGKSVVILATDNYLSHDLRSKVGQGYINFQDIQTDIQKD